MRRREMLAATGAAIVGLSSFPFGWVRAAEGRKQRLLYFTRSAGFEHGAVKRQGGQLGFSERVLTEMGKRAGFEVVCTKDGSVFDQDLDQWDCIAFYTSGDLTKPNRNQTPPATRHRLCLRRASNACWTRWLQARDSWAFTRPPIRSARAGSIPTSP